MNIIMMDIINRCRLIPHAVMVRNLLWECACP
jgi:hypothetical protein